jgi:PhnB protein
MQLSPYLAFDGNCETAFKFYEECTGGKILSMFTHAGTPMEGQVPPEHKNKIMHAQMKVGDSILMGADAPPGHYKPSQGFCVQIAIKDAKEAGRIFNALAENGKIQMPIQETFWAARFGMLIDKFGIPWMINCEKPM